jgi:anti-anti-sigma factor
VPGRDFKAAEFTVTFHEGVGVVAARGELDLTVVDGFRRVRDEAMRAGLPLVIDLSDCEFIDVAGMACIIRTLHAGHAFAIVGAPPNVRRTLDLIAGPGYIRHLRELADALPSAAVHPTGTPEGRRESGRKGHTPHLAMQEVDDEGSSVTWVESITDEEYNDAGDFLTDGQRLYQAGNGSMGAKAPTGIEPV